MTNTNPKRSSPALDVDALFASIAAGRGEDRKAPPVPATPTQPDIQLVIDEVMPTKASSPGLDDDELCAAIAKGMENQSKAGQSRPAAAPSTIGIEALLDGLDLDAAARGKGSSIRAE